METESVKKILGVIKNEKFRNSNRNLNGKLQQQTIRDGKENLWNLRHYRGERSRKIKTNPGSKCPENLKPWENTKLKNDRCRRNEALVITDKLWGCQKCSTGSVVSSKKEISFFSLYWCWLWAYYKFHIIHKDDPNVWSK